MMRCWPFASLLCLFALTVVEKPGVCAVDFGDLPEGCELADLLNAFTGSPELQKAISALMEGKGDAQSMATLREQLPPTCRGLLNSQGCDVEKLQKSIKSDEAKKAVAAVIAGTASPSSLNAYKDQIPPECRSLLKMTDEPSSTGSGCDVQDLLKSIQSDEVKAAVAAVIAGRASPSTLNAYKDQIPAECRPLLKMTDKPSSTGSGCDVQDLLKSIQSEELKKAVAAVIAGTASPSSLSAYKDQIPAECRHLLKMTDEPSSTVPDGVATMHTPIDSSSTEEPSCDIAAAIRDLCVKPTLKGVRATFDCIPRGQFCAVARQVFSQEVMKCGDGSLVKYIPEIARAFVRHRCPFPLDMLSVDLLGVLPYDYLKSNMLGLTKEQLTAMFGKIKAENVAKLMSTVDCRIWNELAGLALLKGVGAELLNNLALLPILPPLGCLQLQAEQLMPALEKLSYLPFDCRSDAQARKDREQAERRTAPPRGRGRVAPPRCRYECGRIIMKKLVNSELWTNENLISIPNLHGCLDKDAVKRVAEDSGCRMFSKNMMAILNLKARRKLAEACTKNVQPQKFTVDTVRNIGCALGDLPLGALEKIPGSVMCQVIDELTPCVDKNTKNDVKMFYSKTMIRCLGNEDMTMDRAKKMGKLVARAGARKLRSIGKETVKAITGQIRDSLADLRGPAARLARRMIAAIFAEKLDLSEMSDNIDFMVAVEMERMKSVTDEDSLKAMLGISGNTGMVPDMSDSLNRLSFSILKKARNASFSPSDFDGLGSILKGLSASDIDDLHSNNSLDFALRLAGAERVKGRQAEAVMKLLMAGLRARNSSNPLSALPDDALPRIGAWVIQNVEDSDDVAQLGPEKCKLICRKIASSGDLKCGSNPKQRHRLFKACLTCMGKAERGASITVEDIQSLGALLQEDDGSVIDKVPSSTKDENMRRALVDAMPARRRACMSREARQKFLSKLTNIVGDDADALTHLGGWWLELVPKNTTDIDSIEPAVKDLDDDEETTCCRNDNMDDENQEVDSATAVWRSKVATIVQNNVELVNADQRRRRRRQATEVLACTDVYMLGSTVQSLDVNKLLSMDDAEFYSCISRLGEYAWTPSQYSALIQRVIQMAGDICAVQSIKLQELGTLAYGLAVDNITCLLHLDDDAMMMLGSLPHFSQQQLVALVTRYMGLKGLSASQLTAEHLKAIGHALCGLTEEQVNSIPVTAYLSSSSMIGALQSCGSTQLKALASLAENAQAHGPAKDWTPAIVSSIGIVLGGVSGSKIKNYGHDLIEAMSKDGIQHLPKSELQMLSNDQLKWFSREQAMSVTDDQKSAFTLDQKNALLQALYGSDAVLLTTTTTTTTMQPSRAGSFAQANFYVLLVTLALVVASQAIARLL